MNKIISDTRTRTSLDVIGVESRESGTTDTNEFDVGFRRQRERTFGRRPRCENVSNSPNVVRSELTRGDDLVIVNRLLDASLIRNAICTIKKNPKRFSPLEKELSRVKYCRNISVLVSESFPLVPTVRSKLRT